MLKNIKKNPLYQKVTETILSTVITAILSIGLISGSTYLLFGYQSELETIENSNAEFEVIQEQYSSYVKMTSVVSTAPLTKEQINTEIVTINTLKAKNAEAKLDKEFVDFTINWCNNLLMELATAKGSINGYVFQKDSIYDFDEIQNILLSKIDSDISVVKETKSLVIEWEILDIPTRNSRISEIENLVTVQIEKLQSGMSRIKQHIDGSQVRMDALDKLKTESDRAFSRLQIKFTFSIIGIVMGVLLLAVVAYAIFFDSEVKVRPKENKSKEKMTKSKGRSNTEKRG